MKNCSIFYIVLFLLVGFSVKSAENESERVFVFTDKDCYVVGENIWMSFCAMTPDFKPSTLSKVGYIEISDTQKPYLQLKLALKNGNGSGKIRISEDIPSGIYELSGYTRFMRNIGEPIVFKRQIAIINPAQKPEPGKAKLDFEEHSPTITAPNQLEVGIETDKHTYQRREKVSLLLDRLPQSLSQLVISVRRSDSFASVEQPDNQTWLKQMKENPAETSNEWLPEYEGHIVTGKIDGDFAPNLSASLSIMGGEIHYFPGQITPDQRLSYFYTGDIYGPQNVVTSTFDLSAKELPNQVTILSPYANYLPKFLPELQIRIDSALLAERYLGAQLTYDSLLYQLIQSDYDTPAYTYDLDQYTRFPTLAETIFEFIYMAKISKMSNNSHKFKVYSAETGVFPLSNALVFLDGIAIFDQEQLVNYNADLLKKIEIFDGRYTFGGWIFDGIISFTTHKKDLLDYQLGQGSLLFKYDFPSLPVPFETPDYSNETLRNSRKPDFRHTLYWNPEVAVEKGDRVELSFYTSDMKGNFEISVEGIDSQGRFVSGKSYFEVE